MAGLKQNCKIITKQDSDRKHGTNEIVTNATNSGLPYQLTNHFHIFLTLQSLAPLPDYN